MDNADIEILEEELNQDDFFLNNMNSTLAVKRDYEKMVYDHEWLEMLEDVVPYIDNIFHYLNYLIQFVLLLMFLFYK